MMLAKTGAPLPVPDMTPGLPSNDSLASDGAPAFSFQAVLDALQVATLAQAQEGIATEAQPNDETPPDTPPESPPQDTMTGAAHPFDEAPASDASQPDAPHAAGPCKRPLRRIRPPSPPQRRSMRPPSCRKWPVTRLNPWIRPRSDPMPRLATAPVSRQRLPSRP